MRGAREGGRLDHGVRRVDAGNAAPACSDCNQVAAPPLPLPLDSLPHLPPILCPPLRDSSPEALHSALFPRSVAAPSSAPSVALHSANPPFVLRGPPPPASLPPCLRPSPPSRAPFPPPRQPRSGHPPSEAECVSGVRGGR